jgi:uncharacterized radical SAM superfamily Fe-S cluster-containing enzyme
MNPGRYLTTTTSLCPECRRLVPARVHLAEDGVWFHKHCPEHGPQEVRISPAADQYLAQGRFHRAGSRPHQFATAMDRRCPEACGLCPEHEQHVCLPIIEITDHCDLACPICLVDNRASFHLSRAQVAAMLDRLIAAEEQLDLVNLSGGEPTLNPDFKPIVEECLGRPEILRVSVSTNGQRLLREPDLLRFLADRGVVVSLQFDGFQEAACRSLRGGDFVAGKRRLIDLATACRAPMSLTATVAAGLNEDGLAPILDLLFERDNLLSVMLQPMAWHRRRGALPRPAGATTIADVVRALDGACGGLVSAGDFTPLPCSHPACFSLAYYLKVDSGQFLPIKRLVEIDRYLDMLENRSIFGSDAEGFERVKAAVYDLWSGPAAITPDSQKALSAIRRLLGAVTGRGGGGYQPRRAMAETEGFIKSVFIHAFMDPDTFDLARVRKCCNIYPQADGRMLPACVHNCLNR